MKVRGPNQTKHRYGESIDESLTFGDTLLKLLREFAMAGMNGSLDLPVLLLIHSAPQDSPLVMRDISDWFDKTPAWTTGVVDRLEGAGYVRREEWPGDRRIHTISTTRKGTEFVNRLDRAEDLY